MCQRYRCTPKQWREDFSLYEQRVFVHIAGLDAAKAERDQPSPAEADGKQVIRRW